MDLNCPYLICAVAIIISVDVMANIRFPSQIADPFPAWVIKDGSAKDVKIKFIWGE